MTNRNPALLAMAAAALFLASGSSLGADAAAGPSGYDRAHAALLTKQPGALLETGTGRVTCVYGPAFSAGATPQMSAVNFLRDCSGLFGAEFLDLKPVGLNADGAHLLPVLFDTNTNAYRFTLVSYTQVRDGLPVWRSDVRLLVRNEENSPLVYVTSALKNLTNFRAGPDVQAKAIEQVAANESARGIFPKLDRFDAARLVIFAGTPDLPAPPALAWEFVAHGPAGADGVPQKWLFLVDALNGAVLHRESMIHHVNITGTVKAMATDSFRADACDPEVLRGMPYARVQVTGGNVAYADADGNFTIPHGGSTAVTVTSEPRGQYFRVFNQAQTTTSLSQSVTPPGPVDFVHNSANDTEFVRSEVNTYIQANIVRDFTLAYNGSYPGVANVNEFEINVNIADTCNAFYDGSSINFFAAGGACNNTGFGTVVHHEYGHHLVSSAGSGQGAYGEGFSDVIGLLITEDPQLGRGFQSCGVGIRNAANSCQYDAANCSSCGSAIHTCGQLISGAVWSTRNYLLATNPIDYNEILSAIAVNSILLHTGSLINSNITLAFLTLDDNDANIMNGTPHYVQIASGFGDHGLDAPVLPNIAFVFPAGVPSMISPSSATTIDVQVAGILGSPLPGSGALSYNDGSGWQLVPMTQITPNNYQASLPSIACGEGVQFYFTARDSEGAPYSFPSGTPSASLSAISATGTEMVVEDAFETNLGWTVGSPTDTATTGLWTRVNPNGTSAQPEDDHTAAPGTLCFVTGNAAAGASLGAADIDGGATTLTSPLFDLSEAASPRIGYWRWYSNDTGDSPNADVFVVEISNNNGASWVNVETVGPSGPEASGNWFYHEFNVEDRVPATSQMRVRFIAADAGAGSLVEAAVDDFFIEKFLCDEACPGDFDGNGLVEVADIFDYLTAWFGNDSAADVDGVPGITTSDIFFYLTAFFAPCP